MRKGVLATKDALAISILVSFRCRFGVLTLVSFFCLPVFQNKGTNKERRHFAPFENKNLACFAFLF